MSGATLASLQSALAEIYDLPATPDVRDYLMTDRAALAGFGETRPPTSNCSSRKRATRCRWRCTSTRRCWSGSRAAIPSRALTHENLADYLTAAEGVSHFVYVAWNAGHDKPVTLLELELQAEVDKYVLGAWLLREQGAGRFPRELHRALFERARVDPVRGRRSRRPVSHGVELCAGASAGASPRCSSASVTASRAICWRSCGGSIGWGTCASCATSSATPERTSSAAARYSTSTS